MKQLLSLVIAAFLMSACQSASENSGTTSVTENATTSEQVSADAEMPKLNPAHGQPYHDCSIEVGAPLVAKKAPASNGPVKLNPAHGQPGHRCELAVGAPLT